MANNTPRSTHPKVVPTRELDELAQDAKTITNAPPSPVATRVPMLSSRFGSNWQPSSRGPRQPSFVEAPGARPF